jgi:hypothetical protein
MTTITDRITEALAYLNNFQDAEGKRLITDLFRVRANRLIGA